MKRQDQSPKIKLIYLIALGLVLIWTALAESVTVFGDPRIGLWLHAGLMAALLMCVVIDRSQPTTRVWLCLSFAPLIRIVSLTAPLAGFPLLYWYLLTGIPLFLSAFAVVRIIRLPRKALALVIRWSPSQILAGLSGLALGYIEYLILRPRALAPADDPLALVAAGFILIIFTGLLEEIIFRGLMQGIVVRVLGARGVIYVALIFTALHLGYHSVLDMFFVFAVALYFGFYVRRTRSILGVSLAHGLINVSLFLIFPILMAGPAPHVEDIQQGVHSPLLPLPKATPTHFRPHTPTPFLPQSPTPSSMPFAQILVDDGDAGFTSLDGRWWLEEAGYGGDLHWAGTHASDPYAEAFWRPTIGTCGRYEVQVHLPERYPTTQQARYSIAHRGGIETVVVDQSTQTGWITLGTYEIAPDDDAYLQLNNATGELEEWERIIVFDAARWTFQSPCDDDSEP